jgi:hypothetical protein
MVTSDGAFGDVVATAVDSLVDGVTVRAGDDSEPCDSLLVSDPHAIAMVMVASSATRSSKRWCDLCTAVSPPLSRSVTCSPPNQGKRSRSPAGSVVVGSSHLHEAKHEGFGANRMLDLYLIVEVAE